MRIKKLKFYLRKGCLNVGFLIFYVFSLNAVAQKSPLIEIQNSGNELLRPVFDDPEKYEVQILYTQIDRGDNGEILFRDYAYRVDPETYFYPASTVKLPVAVLALEKLNELSKQYPDITNSSPYLIKGDSLQHSIANDIRQLFAVSDNEAFNRLFEFLGPDYINSKLKNKGLEPVRISHRLSAPNALETETKSLEFQIKDQGKTIFLEIPSSRNQQAVPLNLKKMVKGIGYTEKDSVIHTPFDFSLKNYFPLQTQHRLMKQLIFSENFKEQERFLLNAEDRDFLLTAMSALPREAGYDPEEFYDSYGKFFLFGDSKNPIPPDIRIFNKVGYAYGTLTETAYIKNESENIEFLLTATILVNDNQIFNDGVYEYDRTGIPFLAELGRQIYELEADRKKKN